MPILFFLVRSARDNAELFGALLFADENRCRNGCPCRYRRGNTACRRNRRTAAALVRDLGIVRIVRPAAVRRLYIDGERSGCAVVGDGDRFGAAVLISGSETV